MFSKRSGKPPCGNMCLGSFENVFSLFSVFVLVLLQDLFAGVLPYELGKAPRICGDSIYVQMYEVWRPSVTENSVSAFVQEAPQVMDMFDLAPWLCWNLAFVRALFPGPVTPTA